MTAIYHITHVDNLRDILHHGGLYSDAERTRRSMKPVCIAYTEIKDRRSRKKVDLPGGMTLDEYVPFYFSNRSPMLYAIHTKSVPGYSHGDSEIIYLVSSAERVSASDRGWCFSDGHAIMEMTEFYCSLDKLCMVDWDIIDNWSWGDRPDDPDRKRRKQAEFLVSGFFPWELVDRIGVKDKIMLEKVNELLASAPCRPDVSIESDWYYQD